jgi:hypothetical protein
MTNLFTINDGWTANLDAQLLVNGAVFDFSGMVVSSVVKTRAGRMVDVVTQWIADTQGTVRLLPVNTDFTAEDSPYTLRYKVIDGAGKVAYFPEGDPYTITVKPL